MFESNTITVVIDPEIDNQGVIAKALAVALVSRAEARDYLFGICPLLRRRVFLRTSCR